MIVISIFINVCFIHEDRVYTRSVRPATTYPFHFRHYRRRKFYAAKILRLYFRLAEMANTRHLLQEHG